MDKHIYDKFGASKEIMDEEIRALKERERKMQNKIITIIIIVVVFYYFRYHFFFKHYQYIESFHEITPPIQTKVTNSSVVKEIDGIRADIQFIEEYQIDGVVISKYKYYDYDFFNQLSPIDVGIAWGYLADEWKNAKWENSPSRFLHFQTKDSKWYDSRGGYQGIGKYFSNNHLIAENSKIEKQLKHIKKGDYIRIEGYLANVKWQEKKGEYTWNSSVIRDDYGAGACEIIYVTGISWLKEK